MHFFPIPILLFSLLFAPCRAEEVRLRQPLPDAAAIAALPADGGDAFNRLIFETSPYLRQHARNPVDWRPWGETALALALAEDKPIFLSVGYSTCHWCHVMEHESFENEETAAILNANYVCIKVDREERPDLDAIYMSATQLFAGRGGWPNSVWLTPAGKPWFAGTYFPREDSAGRPGFKSMLLRLREVWDERRADVEAQAAQIAEAIARHGTLPPAAGALDRELLTAARAELAADYDAEEGGFGGAPKFPPHQALALLLAEHRRGGDAESLAMINGTLAAMAAGGIHDQLGGGFHRYATDGRWFLPHFEKMLYDNAQLLPIYAEAAVIGGREDFAAVARGIAAWTLRDMRGAEGGFHSALDADSEGEEGRFYLWSAEDLAALLGEEDAARFARHYGCVEGGNYREEAGGRRPGTNILYLPEGAGPGFAAQRELLREARDGGRVWPEKDDKVLTAWNGLMIAGLARAGALLDEPAWIAAAAEAADFLLGIRDGEGRLRRSTRAGRSALMAYLDDYAFLAMGLLALHDATGEAARLEQARELMDTLLAHYWDEAGAGFFFTALDHETLLHRGKDPYDAAIPSGNGAAALALTRLAKAGGSEFYLERAWQLLLAFQPAMERAPRGTATLLTALGEFLDAADAPAPPAGADGPADAAGRLGPLAAELYLARGEAAPGSEVELLLRLGIDAGWHLNAHAPAGAELVPTSLDLLAARGLSLDAPAYPEGEERRFPFSEAPLRIYAGEVWLRARLRLAADAQSGARNFTLQLQAQACDEARCLPPQLLKLATVLRVGEGGDPRHADLFASH